MLENLWVISGKSGFLGKKVWVCCKKCGLCCYLNHTFQPMKSIRGDMVWYTVKPPRRDRIGDGMFGPCREVGPISEVLFVMVFLGENEEITMK